MSSLTILAGLLALFTLAFAAPSAPSPVISFTANFQVRRDGMNGSYTVGSISYSKTAWAIRYDYPDREYTETHLFNSLYLVNQSEALKQFAYQNGSTCDGCKAYYIPYAFPAYYNDPTVYVQDATPGLEFGPCPRYTPINVSSTNVSAIWFNPTNNFICRVHWNDTADYIFDVVQQKNFGSTFFDKPDDCRCQGPKDETDIIILIDRSASIGRRSYRDGRATARDFTRWFKIRPSRVNVLIAQYDEDVSVVLQFFQGISDSNIDAAINTMDCDCGQKQIHKKNGYPDEDLDDDDEVCCGKRTNLGRALRRCGDTYFKAARKDSSKIIIVVSDGKFNVKSDGNICRDDDECDRDMDDVMAELRRLWPNINIFGLGNGRPNHRKFGKFLWGKHRSYTNCSQWWRERCHDVVTDVGCPVETTFCDPTTCCGFCECGECLAPTDCDITDQCNPAGLYGGRCCTTQPITCTDGDLCTFNTCDPTVGCKTDPVVCPPFGDPSQEDCWDRLCDPNSGACVSTFNPEPGSVCSPTECNVDTDCNDNNACTVDRCVGDAVLRSCKWFNLQCDDSDPCTRDTCTDPNIGCQSTPVDPAVECNDGVECTTDFCNQAAGCQSVAAICDDQKGCTVDVCNTTLGHCTFNDIICPPFADNCTLSLCLLDSCVSDDGLCGNNLLGEKRLSSGAIAATVIGVTIGAALLAVGGFVAFRIISSSKKVESGGTAGDFAAE